MFERNLISELREWAAKPGHKPLVLRGARQVGKSTLVDRFGQEYDVYLKLNLELSAHSDLFRHGRSVHEIMPLIYYLNRKEIPVWIRHVVVPTVTDDETYLYRLGWFIGGLGNLKALDVLPYHTMGKPKYEKLGIPYRLEGIPAMDRPTLLLKKQAILKGISDRRRHDA